MDLILAPGKIYNVINKKDFFRLVPIEKVKTDHAMFKHICRQRWKHKAVNIFCW